MARRATPAKIPAPAIDQESSALSGYRIMWLFVLFDLPVGTKRERKAANGFRHALLDLGFEMSQFSVYIKYSAGKEQGTPSVKAALWDYRWVARLCS